MLLEVVKGRHLVYCIGLSVVADVGDARSANETFLPL